MENNHLSFCPQLCDLVQGGQVKGRSGKTLTLGGVSTVNNLVVLRNLLIELQPKKTLEIGLGYGGSALVFAASHRDLGRSPSGQHVAVDPFQRQRFDEAGLMALESAGLAGYVSFHLDYSALVLSEMLKQGRRFDFVYVDGSHLFEDVFVDFYFVTRLLEDTGVVVFDDSSDPHVAKVLRFIRTNYASAYDGLDLGRYRADRGRSLKYRLAQVFGRNQLTAFRRVGELRWKWNAPLVDF